jgi:hypothetical protein
MKLGAGLFDLTTGGRRIYMAEDVYRATPVDQGGTKVLYGVSSRLELGITTFDVNTRLSLPFLAAQAQVGNATINYRMELVGWTGSVKDFLSKGEFNVEGYARFRDTMDRIKGMVFDDVAHINPEPLFVEFPTAIGEDAELVISVATTFAVRHAGRGDSVMQAFESTGSGALLSPLEMDAIRRAYLVLGIATDNQRPTSEQRNRAKELLQYR